MQLANFVRCKRCIIGSKAIVWCVVCSHKVHEFCCQAYTCITIYSKWTTFVGHINVHSSFLVFINKYIENNREKQMLVPRRFSWLGWPSSGTAHVPEEGRPNRPKHHANNVCFCLLFSIYLIMTTKTELLTFTWPPKAVRSLYMEIYLIAFKQPSTVDCIAIWPIIGSPSYYLACSIP